MPSQALARTLLLFLVLTPALTLLGYVLAATSLEKFATKPRRFVTSFLTPWKLIREERRTGFRVILTLLVGGFVAFFVLDRTVVRPMKEQEWIDAGRPIGG